ncbi:MAG: hypothetical protein Q7R70_05805 [Candidatus Diapherotrites archaeon]|nr:hypothetical protein [Candidatus Diapherotrites archaeon]
MEKWIKETLKNETSLSLRKHIVKHSKEVHKEFNKSPEKWSASMRNLIDAFDELHNSKPATQLRLNRLAEKYLINQKRYTPPPQP